MCLSGFEMLLLPEPWQTEGSRRDQIRGHLSPRTPFVSAQHPHTHLQEDTAVVTGA